MILSDIQKDYIAKILDKKNMCTKPSNHVTIYNWGLSKLKKKK